MSTDSTVSVENIELANSSAAVKPAAQQQPPAQQEQVAQLQRDPDIPGLGRSERQPRFDRTYMWEVAISIACLVASVLVINPRVPLSHNLGFQNQLIIIGALLSLMNQCMKMRLLPRIFLVLEARLGRSILQNYSAILTNDFLAPDTTFIWRALLFFFLLVPIGLSIGYKYLLGGVSSAAINPNLDGQYGLNYPPLGDYALMNNSIYLMMNAAAGFMAVASNDSVQLPSQLPTPYGFNLLLLSSESAAALDIPLPGYLQLMQRRMKSNETWRVSASANAFVGTYNRSTATLKANDDFWNQTRKPGPLHSFSLFDTMNEFSALMGLPQDTDGAYYLLGSYPVSGGQGPQLSDVSSIDDERFSSFRNSSLMFNIRRQKCKGEWNIDRSGVKLISGDCGTNPTYVDSSVLRDVQLEPFWLDTIPVLVHSIGAFANSRNQSHWLMPSFATGAVTAFWARAAFMRDYAVDDKHFPDLVYRPQDELIVSTVQTLKSHGALYFIVAFQPALTLAAALLCFFLHQIPIGKGFGLVSILSGVNGSTLHLLRGAGFSGKLRDHVSLRIKSIPVRDAADRSVAERIEYTLSDDLRFRAVTARLQRKTDYE